MVAGQVAGIEVAKQIGLQGAAAQFFALARWPITALLLLTGIDLIYWVAPNVQLPFKWITPGALMFVTGWLIATFLFGLYVKNLGSYGATYGTLGSIVVLLIWFYLTAFILLLGVELNAVLVQEEPPDIPERVREGAGPGPAAVPAVVTAAPARRPPRALTLAGVLIAVLAFLRMTSRSDRGALSHDA